MAAPDHEDVRRLFHAAVDLPEDKRQDFLTSQCSDLELIAAVNRLLKFHQPEQPLLDENNADDIPDVDPAEALTSLPPQKQVTATFARGRSTHVVQGETLLHQAGDIGKVKRRRERISKGSIRQSSVILGGCIAIIMLAVVGLWLRSAIEGFVIDGLQKTMQSILNGQQESITTWLKSEEQLVEVRANQADVQAALRQLVDVAEESQNDRSQILQSSATQQLSRLLTVPHESADPLSFAAWTREGILIADSHPKYAAELIGNGPTEYGAGLLSRVFRGETVLWLPSFGQFITSGLQDVNEAPAGITLLTPVYGSNGRPFAAMLIADGGLQTELQNLLAQGNVGDTGQSYAFAADGRMLSATRYANVLPIQSDAGAVRVADPGGNLITGHSPLGEPGTWPLTVAAASAVNRQPGSRFQPYRDFAGVPVVGVWTWIPRYRFGIIAEVQASRAYGFLSLLNTAFLVILGLVASAILAAVVSWLALLRSERRKGAPEAIGPYALLAEIGEGGFAKVYLANHSLMRRKTALKVLKKNHLDSQNLLRFEREVQLASQLTHPNTIRIYDYGSTTDGRFYYAMEYIEGLTLQELVEIAGPLPPERVVYILKQICRSLREAHSLGLVHRDIKPQNIMLCARGNEYDTVKVLDFGLARNLNKARSRRLTETKMLIGTPLYIAPERITDPSRMLPQSDIFSLGIVAYLLLTGREPMQATDSMDALAQTMNQTARRPSEELATPIPEGLDSIVHACQLRSLKLRPETVDEVLAQLNELEFDEPWDGVTADAWWQTHAQRISNMNEPRSLSIVRDTIETALDAVRQKQQNTA